MHCIQIVFLILVIWGCYDYLKILFVMKKYSNENIKIVFTVSIWRCIVIFGGLCLGILCMIWGIVHSQDINILLGGVCFSALSRDFCHSYMGVTKKGILLNGRMIGYEEVKRYGSVHSIGIMGFVNIFKVCTPEYKEYIFAKKDCGVIDEILG